MNKTFISLMLLAAFAGTAQAHVSLEQKTAAAGSDHTAVFRVGHGCDGSPTTAVAVQLPAGFTAAKPQPKAGWTLTTSATQALWTAATPQAAIADGEKGPAREFALAGKLPAATGPLWFKVLQTCAKGSHEWTQLPATGTSVSGLKSPAVLLDVQDPKAFAAAAMVQVDAAWMRPTVPGQKGTGGFMKLTAKQPLTLVGASSPVAGIAEVHEMKMEGEVMKMRAVASLALPAGKMVELSPGGSHHLMLMDLKQPLVKDTVVPVTLILRDEKGVESRLELKVPVDARAPQDTHKH